MRLFTKKPNAKEFKILRGVKKPNLHQLFLQGDTDEDVSASGFHMGVVERRVSAIGPGFSLKF